MENQKGLIGLQLSKRSKPDKGAFDYRKGPTQQWVEELPVGNVGETAKQLYQVLQEVNGLAISWKDRQTFLEQVREPISYVQQTLVRHYTHQTFPLPAKTQQIATLAQTLYSEMALGYKIAIEDMLSGSFLSRDNKALIQLIHRAITYLGQAIMVCYQIYAPHPRNSWWEIHQLYRYAEQHRYHNKNVKDHLNLPMPKSSILQIYTQILLLALAGPYRLRQGETEMVFNALRRWSERVKILPYGHEDSNKVLFVVHLDSDEAPDYQAFSHRDCNQEFCRLVDTRKLIETLQNEYEQFQATQAPPPLSRELLFRLTCTWSGVAKRQFSRTETNTTIEAVIGMTMLHQALVREVGDPAMLGKRASYHSKPVPSASQYKPEDIWNLFASSKIKKDYEAYHKANPQKPQHSKKTQKLEEPPKLEIQHWQVQNESAGGYRLALIDEMASKVQVGELVGRRPAGETGSWIIGVVRWLRQSSDNGLEIGVQTIAPQGRPVMVKNEKAGGRASEFQYAILLPAIAGIGQPASIITPILLFQPGNDLLMYMSGHHTTLRLEEAIQESGAFIQFHYRHAEEGNTAQKDPAQPAMDDLWDII